MTDIIVSQTIRIRVLDQTDGQTASKVVAVKNNDLVVEQIVENREGATGDIENQLWEFQIIADKGITGQCLFKHYQSNLYICYKVVNNNASFVLSGSTSSDSPTFPNGVHGVWDFRLLPNWYDDDLGAPRPYQIATHEDKNSKEKTESWHARSNNTLYLSKPDKEYYNVSKMANEVWYLEAPRIKTLKQVGKPMTLKVTVHEGEKVELWNDLLRGMPFQQFPNTHQDSSDNPKVEHTDEHHTTYTYIMPVDKGEFYMSGKRKNEKGEYINESTQSPFPVNPYSTKIAFYYGDPHSGTEVEVDI